MLVAMPTAMPDEPLTSRFGMRVGSVSGSLLLAVVVRHEIDGFHVDVGQHVGGDALEPALGVAVGRGRIAVDRAEVALAVDQRVAHREVLRHAHQRLVGRGVAVRVVLAEHVADDPRALDVGPVPDVVRLVHREQDAAVHRLQPVAHVGQRPPDDHAHRVIEVGAAHLLFEADRECFFCDLIHECGEGGGSGWRDAKKCQF